MMMASSLLSAVPGLRHAFFTCEGGVSEGIYASLNGGLGSNDDKAKVGENRRRMAKQLGVTPICAAMRARFSVTFAGSSFDPGPPLRLA